MPHDPAGFPASAPAVGSGCGAWSGPTEGGAVGPVGEGSGQPIARRTWLAATNRDQASARSLARRDVSSENQDQASDSVRTESGAKTSRARPSPATAPMQANHR